MADIAYFFTDAWYRITTDYIHQNTWRLSQVFAFFALITMFWSFQITNKLKMLLLLGLGTTFLAISAAFLGNWTLTALFAVASIRNYVFCYLDVRRGKGIHVEQKVYYIFAAIFITAHVGSTALLVHVFQVDIHSVWLEWLICTTLIGLVIGNVSSGTHLMRVSFVVNRMFNIINHAYFGNAISVVIACLTISSNIIFYVRQLVKWIRGVEPEGAVPAAVAATAEPAEIQSEDNA